MKRFVDVILPLPLAQCFTYSLPSECEGEVQVGCRVVVPFGKSKSYTAIIYKVYDTPPDGTYEMKEIQSLIDRQPILTPIQFKFWEWLADYYLCTLGEVFKAAVPSGEYDPKMETCVRLTDGYDTEESLRQLFDALAKAPKQLMLLMRMLNLSGHFLSVKREVTKKDLLEQTAVSSAVFNGLVEKGVFETYTREVSRLTAKVHSAQPLHILNEFQQRAFEEVNRNFQEKNVCLLHGVTSSGKTEVYLHLIEQTLKAGQQVLYLLPEIALTTQITERLQRVFGNQLGVYHSKFSDAERAEIWQKQLSEQPYPIVLGVRSSVFLPYHNLGLVIVDEEHETTYKQYDPAPRYHARNAAMVLAAFYGAKTLLGTATPSVESYNNAQSGKYGLVILKERYQEIQLPEIRPVDVAELRRKKRMKGFLSPPLLEEIGRALNAEEQVILFQNRRGFAPLIECKTCGWIPKCENCDVSLTYHKKQHRLTCHYCGYSCEVPHQCPACEGETLTDRGFGTEKVEDEIQRLFPQARVARMDMDTTRTKNAYEKLISDFETGQTNVLIGTQMVSKGLDFEHVSVVGILDADLMLNYPDFRSYERSFQLMAQVAGRAGRKGKRGLVMLQTKKTDEPVIHHVIKNDYEGMYISQMAERQAFKYPPYYRLIYVFLKHRDHTLLEEAARVMAEKLRSVFGSRILGPDKPPIGRIQMMHIQKIMLKIEHESSMSKARQILRQVQQEMLTDVRYRSLVVYYDVDPM